MKHASACRFEQVSADTGPRAFSLHVAYLSDTGADETNNEQQTDGAQRGSHGLVTQHIKVLSSSSQDGHQQCPPQPGHAHRLCEEALCCWTGTDILHTSLYLEAASSIFSMLQLVPVPNDGKHV